MTTPNPILKLQNVRRFYGEGKEALKGVSLSIEPGEVVGLIGPNGAGKSTLLRIATGILKQHSGEVRVFGLDPWEHPVEVKRRIGYVAERQAVPGHLSVRNLIDLHKDLYSTWDESLERELLSRLAIDEKSAIGSLSKGQGRKAILLCAIAHRPELLILDEPAGGLDPAARREFLEVSIELLNQGGSTIVFSSHHMGDVERIASRVAILDEGQMLLDADLADFGQDYCLAVMPAMSNGLVQQLSGVKGCLRSRKKGTSRYAVFAREPEELQAELTDLGFAGTRCTRTSLEETFVAMIGDAS